jgi:hypothetical protein
MTAQTSLNVLIVGHGEQPTPSNFLDSSELVRLEFVNLELLDDESTISSCSADGDSSIESSLGGDFETQQNEIDLPLALSRRVSERRLWSSSPIQFEDLLDEVLELDSLRLPRHRSILDGSRRSQAAEQNGNRGHVLEEDSLCQTRARFSANNKKERRQRQRRRFFGSEYDSEEESPIDSEIGIPQSQIRASFESSTVGELWSSTRTRQTTPIASRLTAVWTV